MKNKNISDFVAASMNAVLNSDQHKSLFNTQYKFADTGATNPVVTQKPGVTDIRFDKPAVINAPAPSTNKAWDGKDSHSAKSHKGGKCEECGEHVQNCYCMPADDVPLPADDEFYADTGAGNPVVTEKPGVTDIRFDKPAEIHAPAPQKADDMKRSTALNVAIDSLLTASAALDSVGMAKSSTLSLKLASLVVEAKKKMSPEEKKKLMERLQKGKKGKKPASSSSSSSSSKGSSSSSSSSKSSSSSSSDPKKKVSKASFEDLEDELPGRTYHMKEELPEGTHQIFDPFEHTSKYQREIDEVAGELASHEHSKEATKLINEVLRANSKMEVMDLLGKKKHLSGNKKVLLSVIEGLEPYSETEDTANFALEILKAMLSES